MKRAGPAQERVYTVRARTCPQVAGPGRPLACTECECVQNGKTAWRRRFFMCGYFPIFLCYDLTPGVVSAKISCNVFFHGRQCVCMGRSEIFNSSKKLEHLSLLFAFFRQSPKSTLKKSEKF